MSRHFGFWKCQAICLPWLYLGSSVTSDLVEFGLIRENEVYFLNIFILFWCWHIADLSPYLAAISLFSRSPLVASLSSGDSTGWFCSYRQLSAEGRTFVTRPLKKEHMTLSGFRSRVETPDVFMFKLTKPFHLRQLRQSLFIKQLTDFEIHAYCC